jgi:DNA polymerase-1
MKYVLLDISGIIYRAFFALSQDKFHRSDGFPTNAILGTINILKQLNKKFPDHTFISCRDSKRSELLRSQDTDTYKQNRKSADPVLAQQFEHIYKSIEALNITSVKQTGYEADDIIATLAYSLHRDNEVVIVSSDKDMNQLLVYDNVKIFNPAKKQFFDSDDCFEKFQVHPHNFTFYQAFVGDASDNIQGIKGVGPKTAVKLINKYETIGKFKSDDKSKYYKDMNDFTTSLGLVTLVTSIEIEDTEYKKQNFKTKEFKEFCKSMEIRG